MPHGFNDDKSKEELYSKSYIDMQLNECFAGIETLYQRKADLDYAEFNNVITVPTKPTSENNTNAASCAFVKAVRKETFKSATVKITASQAGAFIGSVTIPTGYEPMSVTVIAHNNLEFSSVTLVNRNTSSVDVMLNATDATTITAKVFFLKTGL